MAPVPGCPDARGKLRRALGIGGTAFGVLVAVGVAALFLTLMGARKTGGAELPVSHAPTTTWQTTPVAPRPGVDSRGDRRPVAQGWPLQARDPKRCSDATTYAANPSHRKTQPQHEGHSHVTPPRVLGARSTSSLPPPRACDDAAAAGAEQPFRVVAERRPRRRSRDKTGHLARQRASSITRR